jgi:succinoglycan biosynthesis protein ExoM
MRIDVCIATFKRPRLLDKLLRELLAQQLPDGVSAHIIVVDNDIRESARSVVAAFQRSSPSVDYLTQPEQNIALTRNRALDHSQGELIAFIDDDESAPPGWLAALLNAMEQYAADAVFGPVSGVVPPNAPQWIAKGRFFDAPTQPSGTLVRVGGAGNAMVKASLVRGKLAFDPRYGLAGSEDTDFFYRLWCSGGIMVWCQEAALTEYVGEERLMVRWLLERGFGAGQGYADAIGRPSGRLQLLPWFGKRMLAMIASLLMTIACVPFSRTLTVRYAMMLATNLGRMSTILGYRHERYRSATR